MGRLNSDNKALLVLLCLGIIGCTRLIVCPNRQIFQILIRYIGICDAVWVLEDLLLLLLELFNQSVKFRLELAKLIFVLNGLKVALTHLAIHVF